MESVTEIASAVRSGRIRAGAVVERYLARIEAGDGTIGAVTRLLANRARREADLVDAKVAAGTDPGRLAGVPYGVKGLFDVAGLPTMAGSSIYVEAAPAAPAAPAATDAEAIQRLRGAGAILIATLNMDEFAYGFTTINVRHGTTRNPHDVDRLAGGSSGGSAAAVSAGMLPFSLGSDTNRSIRVPAGLTGLYGLKPTHGSLSMRGVFPFAESFDDIGPFTRSMADLRLVWDVLADRDSGESSETTFRVARLGGRFRQNAHPDQLAAMEAIAPSSPVIDLPDVARARSASFLMTAAEGGILHRQALSRDVMAFDPMTRDRLIAGALVPPELHETVRCFRTEYGTRISELFAEHDILLAPSAPCVAPLINDPCIMIDGVSVAARSDLGIHTQPISFASLPALSVPIRRPRKLPLGIQLIARRDAEPTLFRFADMLERQGVVGVSPPPEGNRNAG